MRANRVKKLRIERRSPSRILKVLPHNHRSGGHRQRDQDGQKKNHGSTEHGLHHQRLPHGCNTPQSYHIIHERTAHISKIKESDRPAHSQQTREGEFADRSQTAAMNIMCGSQAGLRVVSRHQGFATLGIKYREKLNMTARG